jgi:DNA-binding CsgD family transcriptional regulator
MTQSGTDELERGREYCHRQAWSQAFAALSAADRGAGLGAEDLERLATSAYLLGRDDHYLASLERAYEAYLDAGKRLPGARCAFWLGLRLLFRGETGRATGWLARAERLVESEQQACAERGYLMLPAAEQRLQEGDWQSGYAIATSALEIGQRFSDKDLTTCAQHQQGRALLLQGDTARGLAMLDEAMLAVSAGNLSPIVTGLVYCSVIEACQQVFAVARAHEWTFALAQWCEQQSELVAFTGTCLVHRAEILQLHGDWFEAIEAARRACERCEKAANRQAAAAASYQVGEVHRLRGEFAQAEAAYRSASRRGHEPQPGLALLRLAQGRVQAAARSIRRVAVTAKGQLEQSRVLPACVEIMLAAHDSEAAGEACRELEGIAAKFDSEILNATAAHARGAVLIAEGDCCAALLQLRHACEIWQQMDVPYHAARAQVLIGRACQALGDDDGMELALDAARTVFEQLGALPDLARVERIERQASAKRHHGLTRRERQVLRQLATGKSNRDIASELSLSERTVDRHVSNIFAKLDVASRSAATAYAYRHELA